VRGEAQTLDRPYSLDSVKSVRWNGMVA
jgi:hypothetical protein